MAFKSRHRASLKTEELMNNEEEAYVLTQAPQTQISAAEAYANAALSAPDFNFPKLNEDGTLPDLRGKLTVDEEDEKDVMVRHNDSSSSLAESEYDFVDDGSEASDDDGRTASLQLTPPGSNMGSENEGEEQFGKKYGMLPREDMEGSFMKVEAEDELNSSMMEEQSSTLYDDSDEEVADESVGDLETPKQSTTSPTFTKRMAPSPKAVLPSPAQFNVSSTLSGSDFAESVLKSTSLKAQNVESANTVRSFFGKLLLTLICAAFTGWFIKQTITNVISKSPHMEVVVRREALASALIKATNNTEATKIYNINSLLPQPTVVLMKNGEPVYGSTVVLKQAVEPNQLIISMPRVSASGKWHDPKTVQATKNGKDIAFNNTKLIDGVVLLSLDKEQCYGPVDVNILSSDKPPANVTVYARYSSRVFQRTYEKAGTELSKSITRDLSTVKRFGEHVLSNFTAGVMATKNVTQQITTHMCKDLQTIGTSALQVVDSTTRFGNATASHIRKDIQLAKDDFFKTKKAFQDGLTKGANSIKSLVPSTKDISKPLAISHRRALGFKDKFADKLASHKNTTKAVSPRIDLAAYLHKHHDKLAKDYQKQLTTLREQRDKAAKECKEGLTELSNLARCITSGDFAACRKAQQSSMPNSHSTVPGQTKLHPMQDVKAGKILIAAKLKARELREAKRAETRRKSDEKEKSRKCCKKQTQ